MLAVILQADCATKKYTRTSVGEVNDKVETLGKSLEETQERQRATELRISEATQSVDAANDAAHRIALLEGEIRELRKALDEQTQHHQTESVQLPWPLPTPTIRYELKPGLITSDQSEQLSQPFSRLKAALKQAEIAEYSTYSIGEDGFAVVARLECIDDKGVAKPDRWCVDSPISWSLWQNLGALFYSPPGRYRVLVFAVTPRELTFSKNGLTPDAANDLLKGASQSLDPTHAARLSEVGTRTNVLIYEFVRVSYDASPAFASRTTIGPANHLTGARLWTAAQLR